MHLLHLAKPSDLLKLTNQSSNPPACTLAISLMMKEKRSAPPLCQNTFNSVMKSHKKKHQHQRKPLKLRKHNQQQQRSSKSKLPRRLRKHQRREERKSNTSKLLKLETLWLTLTPIWKWLPLKLNKKLPQEQKLSHFLNKSQTLNNINLVD